MGGREAFRVAGLSAVSALFAKRPEAVERLFLDARLKEEAAEFCRFLGARRRPFRIVEAEELARVNGSPLHGGIVAVTRPPVLPDLDLDQARAWAAEGSPLMILDGVGNPHNLGAIVRTLAFFGLPRLAISDHPGQAGPSEAAWRVAEGGMEHVALYRVTKLPVLLARFREHYRVVGTVLAKGRPLKPEDLQPGGERPVALVLGNEEEGLSPATRAACADVVTILGSGHVQSLNVAATAAILAFQMSRN